MEGFLRKLRNSAAPVMALALLLSAEPGFAEDSGRFVLKEAEQNSFIRLDTITGAVSHCSSTAGKWNCRSVQDDTAELLAEIARLKEKNQTLEKRLAEARDTSPLPKLVLPSEPDFDRVMALLEKYLERFMALIRKLDDKPEGERI